MNAARIEKWVLVGAAVTTLWIFARMPLVRAEDSPAVEGGPYAYLYHMALAEREWHAGNLERAVAHLDECPEKLRHWEWRHLNRLCRHGDQLTLKGPAWAAVSSLAFSPDGKRVAAAGYNRFQIWDTATGEPVWAARKTEARVGGLCFSPDGKRLAVCGEDGDVRILETAKGEETARLKGPAQAFFTADGTRLVGAAQDRIGVWEVTSGKGISTAGFSKIVAISASGDRRALALLDDSGAAEVWDMSGDKGAERILAAGETAAKAIALRPDGKVLAVAVGNEIKLREVYGGKLLRTLPCEGEARALAFSPYDWSLAVAGTDRQVRIWDENGEVHVVLRWFSAAVEKIAFSWDGRRLLSASTRVLKRAVVEEKDGRKSVRTYFSADLRLWDATADPGTVAVGDRYGGYDVAFSPDGKQVATASSYLAYVWDPATGKKIHSLHDAARPVFSPDGKWIAGGGPKGQVNWFDAATGKPARSIEGHDAPVWALGFSRDSKLLATGSGDDKHPGIVKIWDVKDGKELFTFKGHRKQLDQVAFHPDSKRIASAEFNGPVKVWDPTTGNVLLTMDAEGPIAWSPSGRILATGDYYSNVRLWDADSGRPLRTLTGHDEMLRALCFSPDGKRLLSAGGNINRGQLIVWDVDTGQEVYAWRHQRPVYAASFSPDGGWLAVALPDVPLRLFDGRP